MITPTRDDTNVTLRRDPAVEQVSNLQHDGDGTRTAEGARVAAKTHVVDGQARHQAGVATNTRLIRAPAFRQLLGKLLQEVQLSSAKLEGPNFFESLASRTITARQRGLVPTSVDLAG